MDTASLAPTEPAAGDFVIEPLPNSEYYCVRCQGITRLLQHTFYTYVDAVDYALVSADRRKSRTFLKNENGYYCLD